jgi:hypothetical protein
MGRKLGACEFVEGFLADLCVVGRFTVGDKKYYRS